MMPPAVSTPCRRLCRLDPVSGLCTGCGRTGGEIAAWASLSEPARRAIMADLPARRVVRPRAAAPAP